VVTSHALPVGLAGLGSSTLIRLPIASLCWIFHFPAASMVLTRLPVNVLFAGSVTVVGYWNVVALPSGAVMLTVRPRSS
jgi:hypothetical protein